MSWTSRSGGNCLAGFENFHADCSRTAEVRFESRRNPRSTIVYIWRETFCDTSLSARMTRRTSVMRCEKSATNSSWSVRYCTMRLLMQYSAFETSGFDSTTHLDWS
eukprot:Amastigsp_a678082_19.p6 type:complete len:106 gc:universal Amastigsp_a678082_19:1332-1015(-)